ncbi:uncharacterized protein LOC131639801 [Vicia villosa]|uniref:uncharacterized protein LOC131639801 n=1 Tax=Vicia villosa TaxID=3911 RepID=UPI00273CB156|nr:uncharacterized protein LOC131639801 [Vicia villosa]
MGSWEGEIWHWSLGIYCDPEDGAVVAQLHELVILLAPIQPCFSIDDSFVWWRNPSEFTVSNAYDTILLLEITRPLLNNSVSLAFSRLWKTKVPSGIHLFGWRLIWNRLSSKAKLAKHGALLDPNLLVCSLCGRFPEDLEHLFLHCDIARDW